MKAICGGCFEVFEKYDDDFSVYGPCCGGDYDESVAPVRWVMVRRGAGSFRARPQWTGHIDRGRGIAYCGVPVTGTHTTPDDASVQGDKRYCRTCERAATFSPSSQGMR